LANAEQYEQSKDNSNTTNEVDNKLISVAVERIIRTFESMFGGRSARGGGRRSAQFKGQDFNAEFHLDLKEVYTTHKRTLTVNGKIFDLLFLQE
jgi:DnaJ-class molecular chaperone